MLRGRVRHQLPVLGQVTLLFPLEVSGKDRRVAGVNAGISQIAAAGVQGSWMMAGGNNDTKELRGVDLIIGDRIVGVR